MCKVSIVIPNYNGLKYLEDCLSSLEQQSEKDFEVLLVDNGSKDGSIAFVREHYPQIQLIELDRNYGFCRAVNEGIKRSAGDYIILLNNDTSAEPDFVKALVGTMDSCPDCFSGQARMLQMHDPSRMDDGGNYYCALGWAFARGKGRPASEYEQPGKIFASCAGAAIYRRKIFQEIGYFDEEHYAYLEDIDIGYRARIQGYQNRYIPDAVIRHVGSGTTGSQYNEFKINYSARNSIYLIYKNMPFLQILLNLPFLAAGFAAKLLFFAAKGYLKVYLQGCLKGFRLIRKDRKVKVKWRNISHYVRIQLELWMNIIKRFRN